MIECTCSLRHWLFDNYKEKLPLILFGHTEEMTDEMWEEYIEWCKTEDGKQYLEGGTKYEPV